MLQNCMFPWKMRYLRQHLEIGGLVQNDSSNQKKSLLQ